MLNKIQFGLVFVQYALPIIYLLLDKRVQGNIWGVARNEDGDESGWGSRTFFASHDDLSGKLSLSCHASCHSHDDLSDWSFVSEESDQWIYESPKMFRHGRDLYLVARTDPGEQCTSPLPLYPGCC